MQLMMLLLRR
jgi:hypothetical protein